MIKTTRYAKSANWLLIFIYLLTFSEQSNASSASTKPKKETISDKVIQLDIKGQDLASSLVEFALQTQLNILVKSELVQGYTSSPLIGNYTLKQALQILLSKTPLSYRYVQSEHSVIIEYQEKKEAVKKKRPQSIPVKITPPEELFIYARKRPEQVLEVPLTAHLISAEQLETHHVTYSGDTANNISNFAWISEFSKTSPNIYLRGVGSNNFFPVNQGPVAVYQDFVFQGPNIGLGFSAYDLERVEVLKGPQGTLFGRNATGGLVNFIARKPEIDKPFQLYASMDVGQYETLNVEGGMNIPVSDFSAARLSFASHHTSGMWKNQRTNKDVTTEKDISARIQYRIQSNEQSDIHFSLQAAALRPENMPFNAIGVNCDPADSTPDVGQCPDFLGSIEPSDFHATVQQNTQEHIDAYNASLKIQHDFNSFQLVSLSAYSEVERDSLADSDFSPLILSHDSFVDRAKYWSQELRIKKESDRIVWQSGFFYYRQFQESLFSTENSGFNVLAFSSSVVGVFHPELPMGTTTSEAVAVSHHTQKSNTALFSELDIELNSKSEFTFGLRWTKERLSMSRFRGQVLEVSGNNGQIIDNHENFDIVFQQFDAEPANSEYNDISGRTIYKFSPSMNTNYYASYSRGYKGGDYGTGFYIAEQSSIVEPEILDAFEIGFKKKFSRHNLTLNAATFVYDYRNQQVTILEDFEGKIQPATQMTNVASSSIKGAEIEFNWNASDSIEVFGNLGYVDAKYDDFVYRFNDNEGNFSGNRVALSPNWSGSITASKYISLDSGKIKLTGNAYFQDKVYFQPSNEEVMSQDPYIVSNIETRFYPKNQNWSMSLFAKNVFDTHYFVTAFDYSDYTGSYNLRAGPPRLVGLNIKFEFK